MTFGAGGSFRPRIVLRVALRVVEPVSQQPPAAGIAESLANIRDADAFDPRRGALQIARFFAVELHESGTIFQHFGLGADLGEQIGGANGDPAVAADMKVPTALGGDDTEILDRRLGAV